MEVVGPSFSWVYQLVDTLVVEVGIVAVKDENFVA